MELQPKSDARNTEARKASASCTTQASEHRQPENSLSAYRELVAATAATLSKRKTTHSCAHPIKQWRALVEANLPPPPKQEHHSLEVSYASALATQGVTRSPIQLLSHPATTNYERVSACQPPQSCSAFAHKPGAWLHCSPPVLWGALRLQHLKPTERDSTTTSHRARPPSTSLRSRGGSALLPPLALPPFGPLLWEEPPPPSARHWRRRTNRDSSDIRKRDRENRHGALDATGPGIRSVRNEAEAAVLLLYRHPSLFFPQDTVMAAVVAMRAGLHVTRKVPGRLTDSIT